MSLEWWQKSVIYHIYLPAFKDSNNDGIGDFKGLISKLDYFKELKISSILLSPFYPSPMKDNGYDISSFNDIDPKYGTMEDFDNLIQQVKKRGMNIVVDFVANHTSDQHSWFQKSVQKVDPYTDYYIWVDPKLEPTEDGSLPPNNWLSVFDGSAWTWNEQRRQFYFHQFLPEQPDLNYYNPHVKEEMKNVLRFWLDKGVDGFRIDAASHLFEDQRLLDEPLALDNKAKSNRYNYLNHIYTKGRKENLDLIEEWKQLLKEYSEMTGKSKIMIVEAAEDIQHVMSYYGTIERQLADIPMNFQLYKVKPDSTGADLYAIIDDWMSNMPKGKYPNWVMSSHDESRIVTRVGSTLASSLHMVMMLLPGISIWYYGDELGMENGEMLPDVMKDSFALRTVPSNSRDPMRTPMQWNGKKNAGFSDSDSPWLPVNSSFKQKNVEVEKENPFSFLNNFKRLLSIRNQPSVLFGNLLYPSINDRLFSILRSMVGTKCYLLILNMSSEAFSVDFSVISPSLPTEALLEVTNCGQYYGCHSNPFTTVNPASQTNATEITGENYIAEDGLYARAASSTGFISTSRSPISNVRSPAESANVHGSLIKVQLNDIYLEPHQAIVLSYIG